MKKTELYTDKELELFKRLEDDVETGSYRPITEEKLNEKKVFFKQVAINTIEKKTKKRSLNIRLFEDDIEKIKVIALEQGMPYQTLISSIIHKLALKQIALH
ncbi:MAG: antitoxin [Epsilonproteobacteria bacterium]|nr:MAG: antitoxin [Campylobacterota bacterium]